MEKAGSLHASVPAPPPRLYLPRHFSCSACLYGSLPEPCKGGCSPEPEPVEAPPPASREEAPPGGEKPPPASREEAPPPPRSPSPPSPVSPPPSSPRGREASVPSVPPSPTLRRRAKSLPTPGERRLRPALQQSPSRRKTVRFADSLGLELTAVRHFSQADEPRAPPAASPRAAELLKTRKPPALGELEPLPRGPPGPALEPLFPPQPGAGAGFLERVRRDKVRLEWVRPEAAGLRGAVRVLNLAFEKAVSVRYSLDRWASCLEAPAAHLPPPHGATDRFAFLLPLAGAGAAPALLEFAVRYRVAGAEYWDNNGGHNYRLRRRDRPPDAAAWVHFI
ncbi:protein phosphatase 1 regulatory subunit 3E-like [Tiliqua scincoides]|uniref:protein phosphatase 1 regulatory subunit 3E-like n=1 Tax=Tiliqua scincoides TaxID=71010 RepID=UPI0034635413